MRMDMKYGLPGKKKYPMPDRDHVMSAIKFFNYVSPKDEKELAKNIIARIKEYGIKDINVGEKNRFGKYYKRGETIMNVLKHSAKGDSWSDHKYIDKIKTSSGWRYFYDQDELDAYLAKKNIGTFSRKERDLKRRYGEDAVNLAVNENLKTSGAISWDKVEKDLKQKRKDQRTKDAIAIRAKNDIAAQKNKAKRKVNYYLNAVVSLKGDATDYVNSVIDKHNLRTKKINTLSVNKKA